MNNTRLSRLGAALMSTLLLISCGSSAAAIIHAVTESAIE